MNYRFVNACINSGTKASTLFKNLMKIGSVIVEFKTGVCGIFALIRPQFYDRSFICHSGVLKWIGRSQF